MSLFLKELLALVCGCRSLKLSKLFARIAYTGTSSQKVLEREKCPEM